MSLLWKCVAAMAIAMALVAGWRIASESTSADIVVPSHTEHVVFEPLEDAPARDELAETTNETRREVAATAAAANAPSPDVPRIRLEARIVDENHRPLAGATLAVQCGGKIRESISNGRGEVFGEIPSSAPVYARVRVSAHGRVSFVRYESIASDGHVHLGDIVLPLGGAVSGIVRERDGEAIAGATVSLDALDLPQSELANRFTPFVDPHREPSTTTRSDGSFLLEGVPMGFARLLAGGAKHSPGFTGIVEVRAGHESRGLVITLDPLTEDRMLRGIVLDPRGQGMEAAYVEFRAPRSHGTLRAGPDGRFQTMCSPGDSFELFAKDSQERWASVWLKDVRPGAGEVVMQFADARTRTIFATDATGGPLASYAVQIWTADHSRMLMELPNESREGGRATFAVPDAEFVIHVDEPKHWVGVSGPYSPASVPAEVSIRLEAAPQIRGRVVDSSGPVNGARVELYEDQRQRNTYNFFPVIVEPNAIAETLSAPDGSFALSVRGTEPFHVRAEASGHAAGMVGPVALDRGDVEVALTRGGSIEGRVIPAPGQSPAGVIVGFSRGDAHAFTRRVGRDGVYRVEGLTPGPWMVERVERELHANSRYGEMRSGRWDEIPSNCAVDDGRTTYFDLDLGATEASSVLVGELRVDGDAPGAWSVVVDRDGAISDARRVLDDQGRFRVDVGRAAECLVLLTCLSGELEGLRLQTKVLMDGPETRWSLELQTAQLELEGTASELPPKEHFVYMVSSILGVRVALRPLPSGDGRVTFTVPAGKGAIVRMHDESGPVPMDSLPSFELRAGETARCARP